MTKQLLFKPLWKLLLQQKNIAITSDKPSIFPYKPSVVLDKITQPLPPPISDSRKCASMACRAVRRVHKAYKRSPSVVFSNRRCSCQLSLFCDIQKSAVIRAILSHGQD